MTLARPADVSRTSPSNPRSAVRTLLAVLLVSISTGALSALDAAATPAGPTGSIQYNADGTNFGGNAGLMFNAGTSTVTLGGAGNDGVLKLVNDGTTDFTTTVQSGATSNYTLTLPVDDGINNQVLKTNGSGVLSWSDVALNPLQTTLDANGKPITNVNQLEITAVIKFMEFIGGSNYLQVKVPNSIANNQTWELPSLAGTSTFFASTSFAQTLTNKELGAGTTLGADLDGNSNAITNVSSLSTTAGTDGQRAVDFTDNGITLVAPSSGTRLGAKGGELYKSDLGDGTSPKLLLNSGDLATTSDFACTDNPATNQSDCQIKDTLDYSATGTWDFAGGVLRTRQAADCSGQTAAGSLCYDTNGFALTVGSGSPANVALRVGGEREIDINVESPTTTKSGWYQFKDDFAQLQLIRVSCSVATASTSVDIQIEARTEADPNNAGTNMLTSVLTCTGSATSFL